MTMHEERTQRSKIVIAYAGAVALGLTLMAFPSSSAPLPLPEAFGQGDEIRAEDMNARFEELYNAVNQQRRSNGLFCGRTTVASNADLGGYGQATVDCTSAPGCAPETAHMCTVIEAVASVSQGLELPLSLIHI